MTISVIIVNYNTKGLLKRCLASVFQTKLTGDFEVFVSDNGSKDGSIEMVKRDFPQVKLIENGANLGFSKANNVAIKRSSGKYVLLLNSDTEVMNDTFVKTAEYLGANTDVGAMGCKVLLPDGSLDKACRRRFPNPANSFLRLFGFKKLSDYNIGGSLDETAEVDCVMGAYMTVRKDVIEKVGMLDEEYFMYGEDIDWCWRIKHAGYKIMYVPSSHIIHYKYGSSQLIPFRTIRLAHKAMVIFYRKHYAPQYNWLFNQLVYAGIWLRMYLVMFVNIFRSKKTVH